LAGGCSESPRPVGQSSCQLANKDSPLKSFLGGCISFCLITIPRFLKSEDTQPLRLGHVELLTTKEHFIYGGYKIEYHALGSGRLHISVFLIGQLLPQISGPNWLMIQAPPYSNLSDRSAVSYLALQNPSKRFQSPSQWSRLPPLGGTSPSLGSNCIYPNHSRRSKPGTCFLLRLSNILCCHLKSVLLLSLWGCRCGSNSKVPAWRKNVLSQINQVLI
jgi:hypothetical protein